MSDVLGLAEREGEVKEMCSRVSCVYQGYARTRYKSRARHTLDAVIGVRVYDAAPVVLRCSQHI